MIGNLPYLAIGIIVILGLYAMLFKKNLIKIIIGLSIIESGINLLIITAGYKYDSVAPIYTNAMSTEMVLPTPQALTLTSIVIGLAVSALLLSLVITIYRKYNTLNSKEVRRLRG